MILTELMFGDRDEFYIEEEMEFGVVLTVQTVYSDIISGHKAVLCVKQPVRERAGAAVSMCCAYYHLFYSNLSFFSKPYSPYSLCSHICRISLKLNMFFFMVPCHLL